ncbi:MAG: energy transducer TonB [Bacteroidota bacterium]
MQPKFVLILITIISCTYSCKTAGNTKEITPACEAVKCCSFTDAESVSIPMYAGGEVGLLRDLYSNILYPESERKRGIEGTVVLKYTIGVDGTLQEVSVLKSVSEGLDKEAIRVFKNTSKWCPAMKDTIPVTSSCCREIKFKLQ